MSVYGTISKEHDKIGSKHGNDDKFIRRIFHGTLPKADVIGFLIEEGDFLLRETDREDKLILTLSVRWFEEVLDFIVNRDSDGFYYIESHKEDSLLNMIIWHRDNSAVLSVKSEAKIIRGIFHHSWLIKKNNMTIRRKIGQGAFGTVYKGILVKSSETEKIAIKTMQWPDDCYSRRTRLIFMREARIMRKLIHQNIIRFVGIHLQKAPLMIAMEYCKAGSLLKYLRTSIVVTPEEKLRFCQEICAALTYMESLKYIHRDVAARNCLLTKDLKVKLADFGLTLSGTVVIDKKMGKVPIRWLAPESMQDRVFSSKSDVWAYGVLLWEIYTNGRAPYPGLSNEQVRANVVYLKFRMRMPRDTPSEIISLVNDCWLSDADERPSFASIWAVMHKQQVVDKNLENECTMQKQQAFDKKVEDEGSKDNIPKL